MTTLNAFNDEQLLKEVERRLVLNNGARLTEELGRLEKEVRELRLQLTESEKGKSQFLSNIRNEINNPLTSIIGLASSMGTMSVNENVKRVGSLLFKQASSLDFQMRNIIMASEIEMGGITPYGTLVDISSLLEEQVNYLRYKFEEAQVITRLQFETGLHFYADPYLLQFICVNLIANAIEFSARGKVVIIEAATNGSALAITITDFGEGMTAEKQAIIFDRFLQVDTGPTKKHPGHGLGLSIVHALVEMLQGSLIVNSRVNEGTSVTVTIPPQGQQKTGVGSSSFGNEFLFVDEQEF